ncbi:hypothetical protein [Argonema antarcticum]|uniref:hypothetical protein n=1 Tax=Argonema antarcticum TaxID=2942763 RepID=UPI0020131E95|nr:hypothetical protein [Argonema antarcticum]MCL1474068.1 hypothetical protein [Argonema antarcticum A004/B2]
MYRFSLLADYDLYNSSLLTQYVWHNQLYTDACRQSAFLRANCRRESGGKQLIERLLVFC